MKKNLIMGAVCIVTLLVACNLKANASLQFKNDAKLSKYAITFRMCGGCYCDKKGHVKDFAGVGLTYNKKGSLTIDMQCDDKSSYDVTQWAGKSYIYHTTELNCSLDNDDLQSVTGLYPKLQTAIRGWLEINGDSYFVWIGRWKQGFYHPWFIGTDASTSTYNWQTHALVLSGGKYEIEAEHHKGIFKIIKRPSSSTQKVKHL